MTVTCHEPQDAFYSVVQGFVSLVCPQILLTADRPGQEKAARFLIACPQGGNKKVLELSLIVSGNVTREPGKSLLSALQVTILVTKLLFN